MAAVTAVPITSKIIPIKITNNSTANESPNPNEDPDKMEIDNEIAKDRIAILKDRKRLVTNISPVLIFWPFVI